MSGFRALVSRNQLMDTLMNLRGNARACLYTEPLWAVPNTLYISLVAKYMEALGLSAVQIGVVATAFLISQMLMSLLSGVITDKLGRRWATTLMDVFAWCVPLLIWANAQGFAWFLVAAMFNGCFRVTNNAWSLLLTEDADKKLLVNLYALVNVAGLLSGFLSPITSLLVSRYSLVSAMRGLYYFAFFCMVVKVVTLHLNTRETQLGEIRKRELKGKHIFHAFRGSLSVLRNMFSKRPLMLVLGIMSCVLIIRSATDNFWPLLLTGRLGVTEELLPILAGLRSIVMLVCFFVLAPRLRPQTFHKPMRLGFIVLAAVHLMLYLLPKGSGLLVFPGVIAEALALSMLIPLYSSLQMLLMDKTEKARMFGFSLAFCLLLTAPFGAINGLLSKWHLGLPMLLSALLSLLGLYFVSLLKRDFIPHQLDEAQGE